MINKGEKVYKKDGSLLGEFTRTIHRGDMIKSTDFMMPDGTCPAPGDVIDKDLFNFIECRAYSYVGDSNNG